MLSLPADGLLEHKDEALALSVSWKAEQIAWQVKEIVTDLIQSCDLGGNPADGVRRLEDLAGGEVA